MNILQIILYIIVFSGIYIAAQNQASLRERIPKALTLPLVIVAAILILGGVWLPGPYSTVLLAISAIFIWAGILTTENWEATLPWTK